MSPIIIAVTVFSYIALLFGLAHIGDKWPAFKNGWARHPVVYALALGVYCTSWTFYGLVGTASVNGWNFFSLLLGPILLFTIAYPLLERIYSICRKEHIHSIADFIASRYGKRQGVAATVSIVVLLATIPYIALQIKAVADTLLLVIAHDVFINQYFTLVITLLMIVFTLLFGARHLDMSGYHSGLMLAIAFESLIKMLILVGIAVFAYLLLADLSLGDFFDVFMSSNQTSDSSVDTDHQGIRIGFDQPISWSRFIVDTVLSFCAFFCLPRMFHVTFVECLSQKHLRTSRWFMVVYFLVISACVVVITTVGNAVFSNDYGANGDAYVIALPLSQQIPWSAVIVFLGGFSAAMAMIVVATITLSHMLSNDVILPVLIKRQRQNESAMIDFSRSLAFARRLTVIAVIVAAYFYQHTLAENAALTSVGLIAFALIVQLAPGILFGLFWSRGHSAGLYAGLVAGLIVWFYTLMIPLLVNAGLLNDDILLYGLFAIDALRPEYLLNFTYSDSFSRSVVLSLGANILFYGVFSLLPIATLVDKVQAVAFTNVDNTPLIHEQYDQYDNIQIHDLHILLNEFLGEELTQSIFADYDDQGDSVEKHRLIQRAQKALAAVVGVASSQSMIETLYTGKKMAVEEVVNLFGETTKALRFNQEVLSASFENISSGISVIDSDLRLVAWNQHYEDMFNYPKGLLHVGLDVIDIMRFNAKRGLLGEGDTRELIRKRLSYMEAGKAYKVVRFHDDDVVIEIKGQPLPNGGYVTTYDDITEFMHVQKNLEDANANLEIYVQERTQKIEEVNAYLMREIKQRSFVEQELREAKKLADNANASKTKFLALASHDIMQPLNAANLYASALLDSDGNIKQDPSIVKQLKSAIQNTELIIGTLLEVSKLDSGVLQPKRVDFDLNSMLASIIDDVSVQLPEGMSIRYCKTSVSVNSDRHYLHRIVQNFVSNAIKYTIKGKVLVGCRRIKEKDGTQCVEICVYDNGMGISEHEQASIFGDFYRVDQHKRGNASQQSIPGVGLGLSVVARFSELLKHPIRCRSVLHKGSCFSVTVPLVETQVPITPAAQMSVEHNSLQGMVIAYVDDEEQNLLSTSAILDRWQCEIIAMETIASARDYAELGATGMDRIPDVLLMDYQLDEPSISGLELAQELVSTWEAAKGITVPVCVISASPELDLPDRVAEAGFQFLRKPVKPGRLRALLNQLKERKDLQQ